MSHPMWVRGLKPIKATNTIEDKMSHPMWVRGLKQGDKWDFDLETMSHPMWVRGLKPYILAPYALAA